MFLALMKTEINSLRGWILASTPRIAGDSPSMFCRLTSLRKENGFAPTLASQPSSRGLLPGTPKDARHFPGMFSGVLAILYCLALCASGQDTPGSFETNIIQWHESLANRFKAGETNVPLLRVDSLEWPICGGSVDEHGKVTAGSYNRISNASSSHVLNSTNLMMLVKTINTLPASAKEPIPLHRQIHASGVRSNQCFHFVYDTENLPKEVEKLYKILGPPFKTTPRAQ
jgi:hypothetical protein